MAEPEASDAATDRGWIYRSPRLYEFVMYLLYRPNYQSRHSALADLVPPGSSVVEACCGVGKLYSDHLRQKEVRYTGLDLSPAFVSKLTRKGIDAQRWDMRSETPLPRADTVIMQASLYHFLPDPKPIVDRMLEAARQQVIIAEPIRNLTTDYPRLQRVFGGLTDAGAGPEMHRFDEDSLDSFFNQYKDRVGHVAQLAGGREKIYVLQGEGETRSPSP
jgi:SAM-dependent methyltransferase